MSRTSTIAPPRSMQPGNASCLRAMRAAAMLFIAVCACLAPTAAVHAQQFQYAYGNPASIDGGHSVAWVPAGGWIAVGESFDPNNPARSDVYVVRTNVNGVLLWSFTYDLQAIDSGLAVVACNNGDFVITGVTRPAAGTSDLFLLRISPTGAILGVNVFGTASDDYGYDVIECTTGDGVFTHVGDLAVTGTTGPPGARDVFILRTTAGLVQIWNIILQGSPANRDDWSYSLTEESVTVTPPPADIVVAGGTTSWGAGGSDMLLIRVDGFGGFRNAAVIGGTNDESAFSIKQIFAPTAPPAGNLAIAGYTRSRPGALIPNDDAYVLQVDQNLAFVSGSKIFGDPTLDDRAYSIANDNYSGTNPPGLITTGFTNHPGGALTRENVFVQRLNPFMATLPPTGKIYGGSSDERGLSIAAVGPFTVVQPPDSPATLPGYAVCGFTKTVGLIGPDPQQLYLIGLDVTLSSGCNETEIIWAPLTPTWPLVRVTPAQLSTTYPLIIGVAHTSVPWTTNLCGGGGFRAVRGGHGDDDAAAHDDRRDDQATAGFDASWHEATTASAASFPNPVRPGDPLQIRFELRAEATATITITDALGRDVLRREGRFGAGMVTAALPTSGLVPGTYTARILAGDERVDVRFVVRP